jgi:hypothetical protein
MVIMHSQSGTGATAKVRRILTIPNKNAHEKQLL